MIRHIAASFALVAGIAVFTISAAESMAQAPRNLGKQKASPIQRVKGGEPSCEEECCDECKRARGSRGSRAANRAANFNCGCNGSYKFPVPPLSTYHWPGMYSQQLMTDYHSPWRFPPLRPYSEEPPYNGDSARRASHSVQSVSFEQREATTSRGVESLSAKIQRMYRNK